jgi:dihydroneopterin aldolase
MDRIILSAMRFEGRLGVSEEERALPQLVEVDLEAEIDLLAASASDDLVDTVDYAPLVALAGRAVEEGGHRLLEGLAGSIARGVLVSAPAVQAVTVRVRKLAVPLDVDMDHAAVEIRRART